MTFHVAQCNIVKLRAPLDSPAVADFVTFVPSRGPTAMSLFR
jgi:hypothetical protein